MSKRFPLVELEDMPADIRERILQVQEKAGFVPNVFLALARRPEEWRAFFAYHDALMLRAGSSLSKGEREMIVTATSAANHCLYCVVAHGALLRVYEKKPRASDQIAINYRKAQIEARQRVMLDFAMKVCQQSEQIEDADLDLLHQHGFDDEDIWDIISITAFFGMSNRIANATGLMPNPEFYLMGRVARPQTHVKDRA
ncbi:alkylhydroperoxidase [Corticibacter populi]|uniref:Alkylhydroperoxidase n=1 Tax=Corticibacter populi TaxID=1550736 RepID=A0A3M6R1Q2_9BURK|nr:peroxidase-related enzyme [Corticibacter populi]RMX08849.1 alkylhydroperoxidase [Corticibacter populi]RZS35353.1 putative peroxidase-related enzyme [Corticibacter populi]